MPVKRRLSKARRFNVTAEAVARWKAVGPAAVHMDASGAGVILDDDLAAAVGEAPLLMMPDLRGLVEALNEGAGYAGQEA